jgi:choline kinase
MRSKLVILAGGKGTRLGELTKDVPKPMVEVHGKPFLYWLIEHYVAQGFTDITVSTGYKAEVIEQYPWPWRILFEEDYETASHEKWYNAGRNMGWWVVNGDTFIPEPLPKILDKRTSCILSCNDIDAGAQYVGYGKIKIHPVKSFFDIGTSDGLNRFKEYFRTHLDKS